MSEENGFVNVKVFRFDPSVDPAPHYDTFRVPYDEQETILGVLKYIARHHEPGLAFRESCRMGNCLICTIKVNGKGVIACRQTLKDFDVPEIALDPLDEKKVIRDLLCDL